jgi:hypothetical protein
MIKNASRLARSRHQSQLRSADRKHCIKLSMHGILRVIQLIEVQLSTHHLMLAYGMNGIISCVFAPVSPLQQPMVEFNAVHLIDR